MCREIVGLCHYIINNKQYNHFSKKCPNNLLCIFFLLKTSPDYKKINGRFHLRTQKNIFEIKIMYTFSMIMNLHVQCIICV
jgi:hypothetical protein